MKLRLFATLMLVGTLMATSAFALDLHQARQTGQVGEKLDGYIAPLKPDAEVRALVADVNAKRKVEYERIAKEKGQSTDIVAKLAAQEIINNLQPGASYQSPGGNWIKR